MLSPSTNDLLHRTEKNHFKLHMEPKESLHNEDNPKHKEQCWRHHAAGLQIILQVTVIKTAYHWYQNRDKDQ